MRTLKAIVLQKTHGSRARLKGLGVVVSLAIAAVAISALAHALKNVDYDEVFAGVRDTKPGVIVAALSVLLASRRQTASTRWSPIRVGMLSPLTLIGLMRTLARRTGLAHFCTTELVLRNILTARSGGCQCIAFLHIAELDEAETELKARQHEAAKV
jgi:hypothetical protein